MPKNVKGKQILIALLLTLGLEGVFLLCLGWGGAKGWIDTVHPLGGTLAAVAVSSMVGAVYLGLRKWSAVSSALLTGVGAQMILLLAGYFAFGRVDFGGGRWWLPGVGFVAAILSVLFLAKPRSGAKKRKFKRRTK